MPEIYKMSPKCQDVLMSEIKLDQPVAGYRYSGINYDNGLDKLYLDCLACLSNRSQTDKL
jgi:hypothetical protein